MRYEYVDRNGEAHVFERERPTFCETDGCGLTTDGSPFCWRCWSIELALLGGDGD